MCIIRLIAICETNLIRSGHRLRPHESKYTKRSTAFEFHAMFDLNTGNFLIHFDDQGMRITTDLPQMKREKNGEKKAGGLPP